jgi:hypothetical protein
MFKHYSPNAKIQLLQNTNQIPFPLSNSKTAILVTQERIDNQKDRVAKFLAQN